MAEKRKDRKLERDELAHLANAMSPYHLEMLLAVSGPGAPVSLEDAVKRIDRGEPLIPGRGEDTEKRS